LHAAAARAMLRGVKSLTDPVLRAPADRPVWRRGIRAPLAFLAVIGAFWAALNFNTGADEIFGWRSPAIHFSLDGPGWVHWAFVVACPALVLAAAMLWLASRPATVTLALLLFAAGLASVIGAVVVRHNSGRVNRPELDAVRVGASRAAVERRLGWPAGHGTAQVSGQRLRCLIYVNTSARWQGGRHLGLCFRDGRVVYRKFG
jgi:hypothetical protein